MFSSQEKADFLKSIGATHVINLSEEKLGVALPELAPSGSSKITFLNILIT